MTARQLIKSYDEKRWNQVYKAILDYYWPTVKKLDLTFTYDLPKELIRVILCYYKGDAGNWFIKKNPELDGRSVKEVYEDLTESERLIFLKSLLINAFERVMYLK